MIYVKGETQLPEGVEEKLLAELEKYRLVVCRTVYWERLDEGREGKDTYEDIYSLIDTQNIPFKISIIIPPVVNSLISNSIAPRVLRYLYYKLLSIVFF